MDFARKIGQLVIEISGLKEVIASLYSMTVQLGEQRDTARKSCDYWQSMYDSAVKSRDAMVSSRDDQLRMRQQADQRMWDAMDKISDLKDRETFNTRELQRAAAQLDSLKYDIALLAKGGITEHTNQEVLDASCDGYKCSPTVSKLMAKHSIDQLDDDGCWIMFSVDEDEYGRMQNHCTKPTTARYEYDDVTPAYSDSPF